MDEAFEGLGLRVSLFCCEADINCLLFLKDFFFFDVDHFLEVFIEFVTILLLLHTHTHTHSHTHIYICLEACGILAP